MKKEMKKEVINARLSIYYLGSSLVAVHTTNGLYISKTFSKQVKDKLKSIFSVNTKTAIELADDQLGTFFMAMRYL